MAKLDWVPPIFHSRLRRAKWKVTSILAKGPRNSDFEAWALLEKTLCGRPCLVVGNGPSLLNVDLRAFRSFNLFVCNLFYKHPEASRLPIALHFDCDPLSIGALTQDDIIYFRNIYLYGPHTIVVPSKAVERVRQSVADRRAKERIIGFETHYSLSQAGEIEHWGVGNLRAEGEFFGVRHSPMMAIQTALAFRCEPIVLVGLDHRYEIDILDGRMTVPHFYSDELKGGVGRLHPETHPAEMLVMSNLFREAAATHLQFEVLAAQAKVLGIKVLDATPRGGLGCFQKVEWQEAAY